MTLDSVFAGGFGDYQKTEFLARDLENSENTVTFVSGPNAHGCSENKAVLCSVMAGGCK